MINYSDLFDLAFSTLSSSGAISETEIRRSVSALNCQDALTLLETALRARLKLTFLSGENTTTVLLAARLFYGRWTRSG